MNGLSLIIWRIIVVSKNFVFFFGFQRPSPNLPCNMNTLNWHLSHLLLHLGQTLQFCIALDWGREAWLQCLYTQFNFNNQCFARNAVAKIIGSLSLIERHSPVITEVFYFSYCHAYSTTTLIFFHYLLYFDFSGVLWNFVMYKLKSRVTKQ